MNSEALKRNPRAFEIFSYFEGLLTDPEVLSKEYEGLLSGFSECENVFSHNDFQENNVMIWHEDHTKVTIIDFEYSSLNYRGFDIAAYVNECFIDYMYPVRPKFKFYEAQMLKYLQDSHNQGGEFERLLTAYLTRYHQLTDSESLKREL